MCEGIGDLGGEGEGEDLEVGSYLVSVGGVLTGFLRGRTGVCIELTVLI